MDFVKSKLFGTPGFDPVALQHIFRAYSARFADRETRFLKLITAMERLVRSRDARFAVTLLPMNFMIEREKIDMVLPRSKFRDAESIYYDRLSKLLKESGIDVLNVGDAMKHSNEGPSFLRTGGPLQP